MSFHVKSGKIKIADIGLSEDSMIINAMNGFWESKLIYHESNKYVSSFIVTHTKHNPYNEYVIHDFNIKVDTGHIGVFDLEESQSKEDEFCDDTKRDNKFEKGIGNIAFMSPPESGLLEDEFEYYVEVYGGNVKKQATKIKVTFIKTDEQFSYDENDDNILVDEDF